VEHLEIMQVPEPLDHILDHLPDSFLGHGLSFVGVGFEFRCQITSVAELHDDVERACAVVIECILLFDQLFRLERC